MGVGYSSTHSNTSAPGGSEQSVSYPGHFPPGKEPLGTHWIWGWVGPRASLDSVEKRTILPMPGIKFDSSAAQPCSLVNIPTEPPRLSDMEDKSECRPLHHFLAYFPYFEKKKRVGLWDHVAVCVYVCVCIPLSLLRNGSVKVPLYLLGNGSVKTPVLFLGNGSVKIPLSLLGNGSVIIPNRC
jgi:hypothetical protein